MALGVHSHQELDLSPRAEHRAHFVAGSFSSVKFSCSGMRRGFSYLLHSTGKKFCLNFKSAVFKRPLKKGLNLDLKVSFSQCWRITEVGRGKAGWRVPPVAVQGWEVCLLRNFRGRPHGHCKHGGIKV